MFKKKTLSLSPLALLLLSAVVLSPLARAADSTADSKEVSDLLALAKKQAGSIKDDASEIESLTRSSLSWDSQTEKINAFSSDVAKFEATVSKLKQASSTASSWQRTAIDRINPLLQELAYNTSFIVGHLEKEGGRFLNNPQHRDLLKTNRDVAADMSSVISDFVDYGTARAKFEKLSQIEISKL
jgi:hypothetical protein